MASKSNLIKATNLDQTKLNLWSACLRDKIDCGSLIGATPKSDVYRLLGRKQSYVVKLTQDKESISRDTNVNRYLDSEGILLEHRPSLIGHGQFLEKSYIAFSDDNLRYSVKGKYFVRKAMVLLNILHCHPSRRELPAFCRSHTPDFQEIAKIAGSMDVSKLNQSMKDLNINNAAKVGILKLFHILQFQNPPRLQKAKVLCHGDAHAGNFLWSSKMQNWFLIDWEFLHFDSPYFDLFQFVDATSPHGPLQNQVSRRIVLIEYVKRNPELFTIQRAVQSWHQGYFVYAAFHLFWIVQKIWYDLEQGRFTICQLNRQLVETLGRLAGIARDMQRLKLR